MKPSVVIDTTWTAVLAALDAKPEPALIVATTDGVVENVFPKSMEVSCSEFAGIRENVYTPWDTEG